MSVCARFGDAGDSGAGRSGAGDGAGDGAGGMGCGTLALGGSGGSSIELERCAATNRLAAELLCLRGMFAPNWDGMPPVGSAKAPG